MRPQQQIIRLGEREWPVRPLTLRQVQDIEPILMAGERGAKGSVAAAIAIIEIALQRDHGEAANSLADIEATAPEIAAAMTAVLRLGGFIEAAPAGLAEGGNSSLGERQAGAMTEGHPPASISA
jgi:hypothetical protein